jgi:hypothetical protein
MFREEILYVYTVLASSGFCKVYLLECQNGRVAFDLEQSGECRQAGQVGVPPGDVRKSSVAFALVLILCHQIFTASVRMFKTISKQDQQSSTHQPPTRSRHLFGTSLFAFLLLVFCLTPPTKTGDYLEYGIMTIALASHGTPAITLPDVLEAERLNPENDYLNFYKLLEDGIRKHGDNPATAFYRAHDGSYHPIHFFAYSTLAAIPFKIFELTGIPPLKCYQFINLAFVFILGMTLRRFYGSSQKAVLALVLFFFCGGALYWNWTSPELVSAASLLTGLLLFFAGAPVRAAILVGFASMQNPPLVFFAGFAPILKFLYKRGQGDSYKAAWKSSASVKDIASLAIVAILFAAPILFNLAKFGVPSQLAAVSTDPAFITGNRLFSFFFDLNQGMIIGVPALFASMAWILLSREGKAMRILACGAMVFSICMAVPALSTGNWNAGSAGMMRYAFWAAMPLLFVCMLYARDKHVPHRWIALFLLIQLGANWMEQKYRPIEFSPLARFVLTRFPSAYNPDFEIFSERLRNREGNLPKESILTFEANNQVRKIAFNVANKEASMKLCGPDRALSPDTAVSYVDDGWAYINGAPKCIPAATGARP